MSEKLDKLRASLEKEKERRIKINNRIAVLERRMHKAFMKRSSSPIPEQTAVF